MVTAEKHIQQGAKRTKSNNTALSALFDILAFIAVALVCAVGALVVAISAPVIIMAGAVASLIRRRKGVATWRPAQLPS